jgi:hypothetical protein
MIALAFIALLIASATPSPTPTPYKPLAIPTPGATPWSSLSLAGVTLGDTPDDVRARLGEPSVENVKPEQTVWTYAMDNSHVNINVFLRHGRVNSISAALANGAKLSKFADPYGVHLGDGVDTMTSARGDPVDLSANRNSYTIGPGFTWVYEFDHGVAASVLVEANATLTGPLPSAIPVSPGHDGSSVDKSIRFKAANLGQAVLAQAVFLAQFCDGKGGWVTTARAQLTDPQAGMAAVMYGVTCSTTQRTAKYYFDISRLPK